MKKPHLALCSVLVFVVIIGFFEVKKAKAAHAAISWVSKTTISIQDPQRRNTNVFTYGGIGPNNPPMLGGRIAVIDIADRTGTQLRLLGEQLGGPETKRFVLKFDANSQWIHDQLFQKGFITIKWSQIRGSFWDRKLNCFLTGAWRWASATGKKHDECLLNCDYRYCEVIGYHWSRITSYCDCEEWQGRWFCHKKNFFEYSNTRDQN